MKLYFLKSIIRNILNKKFLSVAKILGLVVGFTVFIVLVTKIQYEKSYDAFWKDTSSIYRVALDVTYNDGEEVKSAKNFKSAPALLASELPEVVSYCNYGKDVVTIFNEDKQKIQDVDFVYSDPTFFDVFDRKIIASATTRPLENIHGAVISQSFAKKLFGDEDPINQKIIVNQGWTFTVDAVYEDIPENSHMKIDVIATFKSLFYYMQNFDNTLQVLKENPNYKYRETDPYSQRYWNTPVQYRSYSYIKLKEGTNINMIASQVEGLLDKVSLPQNLKEANMKFIFQPVSDIHLTSNLDHEQSVNGTAKEVTFLNIIILVVLFVCLINFVNLNTISNIELLKNYAIRIFNGASYTQIFQLILMESCIINVVALLMALPLSYYLVAVQLPSAHISLATIGLLSAVVLVTIFIAALVPFITIVKNRFTEGLKVGGQKLQQKWKSQKLLVTLQFSITIILIVCTIGVYKQMQFMMDSELGFNGEQTVYSFTPMTVIAHPDLKPKLNTFRNEVMKLNGVKAFSVSSEIPGEMVHRLNDQVRLANAGEPLPWTFQDISIDDKYAETYGINLVAGDNLSFQNNWNSNHILINQSAANAMGFEIPSDALNQSITVKNRNYTIKGVLEDYHHVSLHDPIKPTLYRQNLQWDHGVGYYSLKLDVSDISSTMAQVTDIWNRLYPKEEFIYEFSDNTFAAQYERDKTFSKILTYAAVLALFISCLGLLGLALFNTKKRVKEIGIRKVSGATITQIMVLLNTDFLKWVLVACIIAIPAAWYVINRWLEDFAYRTTIGGGYLRLLALVP